MCGIVGSHTARKGGFYSSDKEQFRQMLYMTMLRGKHSTGVFGINKNSDKQKDVNIVKVAGSPVSFDDWGYADRFYSRMISDYGSVVGHCRFATMGVIDASTAHPFKEDNITLVHNGVINNYPALHDKQKHSHITVDSNLIARLFADEGAEEILPRLRGAYTLVWWDSNEGTLNIARNKERPLYLATLKNFDVIQFASEEETLVWNSLRAKEPYKAIEEVPTFTHIKFKQGSIEPEQISYKETYSVPATWTNPRRHYPYDEEYEDARHGPNCMCWKCKDRKIAEALAERQDKKEAVVVPLTTIPNLKSKRVKLRAKKLTDDEAQVLLDVKEPAMLERGQLIQAVLHDFRDISSPRSGGHMLYASSDDYPTIEFSAITSINDSEENLMSLSYIEGKVSSIYYVDAETTTSKKQGVRVYLEEVEAVYARKDGMVTRDPLQKFSKPEKKEEEVIEQRSDDSPFHDDIDGFVDLFDSEGDKHSISKYRLVELASKGCAWCTGNITAKEVKEYSNLLFWEDLEKKEEQVICSSCSTQFRTYETAHKKGAAA